MIPTVAQNPDELFDIVTPAGIPTGVRKRRADVHRDGDWHASIHIWVVRTIDGVQEVIFQRRSLAKDTHGGKLDATVGGHLGTGETWREALRESFEEIGASWPEDDLRPIGLRLAVSELPPELSDREVQFVFMVKDERPLSAYVPNPAELAGLVAVPVDALLELMAGDRSSVNAMARDTNSLQSTVVELHPGDFPLIPDRYYYRVALATRAFLNGERHVTV